MPKYGGKVSFAAGCRCCTWLESLPRVDALTDRELEVFVMLARGLPNQGIADELYISERTVRAHLTSIIEKLGLDTRLHACLASYVYLHRQGQIVANDNGEHVAVGAR